MTPADEATFIQLWTQGASYAAIAQAMQLKLGTVGSRASTLVRQGKIQPRPRGGAYPKQKAQGRSEGEGGPSTVHRLPCHRPRWTLYRPRAIRTDLQAALTAALQPVLARLEALETGLARQPHDDCPRSTVHPPRAEPEPPAARGPGAVAGGGNLSNG